jgi:hypothetical protein
MRQLVFSCFILSELQPILPNISGFQLLKNPVLTNNWKMTTVYMFHCILDTETPTEFVDLLHIFWKKSWKLLPFTTALQKVLIKFHSSINREDGVSVSWSWKCLIHTLKEQMSFLLLLVYRSWKWPFLFCFHYLRQGFVSSPPLPGFDCSSSCPLWLCTLSVLPIHSNSRSS